LGIAITVAALYIFLKGTPPAEIFAVLKKTRPEGILASAFLTVTTLYLRGVRWRFILPDAAGTHRKGLFKLVTISFMLNNVLPARLGEAARVYLLHKKNGYSVHASLGSLIVERLWDTVFFAAFLTVPVLFFDFSGLTIFDSIPVLVPVKAAAGILVFLVVIFLFFRFFPSLIFDWGNRVAAYLWRPAGIALNHVLRLLKESTGWAYDGARFLKIILISPIIALCYAGIVFFSAWSLGFSLPWPAAVFTQGFTALGVAVPAAPGFAGTLHLMCQEGLQLFGVDAATAAGAAVLYHLITWAVTVFLGGVFYFQMNLSVSAIKAAQGDEKPL